MIDKFPFSHHFRQIFWKIHGEIRVDETAGRVDETSRTSLVDEGQPNVDEGSVDETPNRSQEKENI